MEKLTESLQKFAGVLFLSGLLLAAVLGYGYYKAEDKSPIFAQEQLTVAAGEALKGTEIAVEMRGRNSKNPSERYFELMVRPDIGADQKWRIDKQVDRASIEKTIGKRVQGKLDPTEGNLVYVLASEGEFLLTYEQTLQTLQGYAQAQKNNITDWLLMVLAALLLVMGVAGIWLRRDLESPDSREFRNTQID